MTRKRYKKSRTKTSLPTAQHQARNISPAAQIVVNRIAISGEDYLKQNLIHIMIDSAQLAKEPDSQTYTWIVKKQPKSLSVG